MKRKLSLLMVLMMVVALVPANLAFAASTSVVNTSITSADGLVEFNIDIEAKGSGIATGDVFELQLNGDADFVNGADTDADLAPSDFAITSDSGTVIVNGPITSSSRVEFRVTSAVDAGDSINIISDVLLDGAEGEQTVTVRNVLGNSLSQQTLTFAVVSGSGDVVVRTLQGSKTITRGSDKEAADFEIKEATPGAFKNVTTSKSLVLRLPKDMNWGSTDVTVSNGSVDKSINGRDMTLVLSGMSDSTIERIVISPSITVLKDAKFGDVEVQFIENDSNIDADNLKIATYKDFSIVLEVEEVKSIIAGKEERNKDYVATITLNATGNSFITGRPIDLTVDGGKVSIKKNSGNGDATSEITGGKYDDEFSITGITSQSKDIEFEVYLKADWDASGEMTITAKGAGVEEQTIKIADVMAPAKISTKVDAEKTVSDVVVGLQEQMAPEIMITETEAGSLSEGYYILDFAAARYSGIEMIDEDIEYEVTGDIEVDDIYTIEKGSKLVVHIDGESSKEASMITIKGLKVTLDRTVPFGNIDLRFGASILDDEDEALDGEMVDPEKFERDYVVEDIIAKTPYLNVVTAVQDQRKQQTVFMIDSVTYMVGSETRTLDAAPFISMNRTMLPIGTVAELVGATVNYSPVSRTAVFVKDNLVVSMNLDTNVLLVNGSPVMMDSKPMIVNSRAFVPVVYVAQAFGIQNGTDIVYDAAMRTVTLFPEVK